MSSARSRRQVFVQTDLPENDQRRVAKIAALSCPDQQSCAVKTDFVRRLVNPEHRLAGTPLYNQHEAHVLIHDQEHASFVWDHKMQTVNRFGWDSLNNSMAQTSLVIFVISDIDFKKAEWAIRECQEALQDEVGFEFLFVYALTGDEQDKTLKFYEPKPKSNPEQENEDGSFSGSAPARITHLKFIEHQMKELNKKFPGSKSSVVNLADNESRFNLLKLIRDFIVNLLTPKYALKVEDGCDQAEPSNKPNFIKDITSSFLRRCS